MTAPKRDVVGNDVIDLKDPAIHPHHERPSFVARVCAEDERDRATTALGLWTLFAAKEAAYKALVKLGVSPGFGHRELRVAPDLRSVCWRSHRVELDVTCTEDTVHAVAWSTLGPRPVTRLARSGADASADVRALACALVADLRGGSAAELTIVRDPVAGAWDGFGPPRVERNGAVVDTDVSLSHDGRFVAAAACRGVR